MPPAVIAGGVAAAGAIGGAVLSSSAQKKAANKASDAQLQVAQENNALAREFRDENQANFQPWLNSGGRANALVDSFLYGSAQPQPAAQPQGGPPPGAPVSAHLPTQGNALGPGILPRHIQDFDIGYTAGQPGQAFYNTHGVQAGAYQRAVNGVRARDAAPAGAVNTPAPTAGGNAMSGYDAFVASPYYQFPLQEGMRQLNTGYAANGMLQSGAAMKGITKFGQDYASGRMGEFIGLAERQSDRGVQAAGGIAGVGMNAMASMSANNQNAANAMSNAAIARGNASANMWSGIGSAVGNFAGSFAPSSYGGSQFGRYPTSGAIGM